MDGRRLSLVRVSLVVISLSGCTYDFPGDHSGGQADDHAHGAEGMGQKLESGEHLVTILQTNDIHGAVEPGLNKDGKVVGGMAQWGGVLKAIRSGLKARYGDKATTLLVDAGDQFQGTLISNFNEGELVIEIMNELGYDAIIPGNHDYDFGPVGWLEDRVTETTADQDPRGALLKLVKRAGFPLLSANTFFKDSIVDTRGKLLAVDGVGCKPKKSGSREVEIDWSKAKRPDFLKPYLIKDAGVRIAIIGIDNAATPKATTAENVSDICFAHEAESYMRVHAEIKDKADIFILIIHNGNSNNEFVVSELVKKLNSGSQVVDAVVAGHTHFVNDLKIDGVPVVQSGANGRMFGRIDLVWDKGKRKLVKGKTRAYGGITVSLTECAKGAKDFCKDQENSGVKYEGVEAVSQSALSDLISRFRKDVEPIAKRRLGVAHGLIKIDRIKESALANAMTDVLKKISNAEIAFLNTGGLRAPLQKGEVTYEELFKVIPFANHAVVVGPMSVEKVIALVKRSVKTCGSFGALMQSGLRVTYQRDCKPATEMGSDRGIDIKAKVLRVETAGGALLFDGKTIIEPGRSFQVATLDFLSSGGSGYDGFVGVPLLKDLGILREIFTEHFLATSAVFTPEFDGRWKEVERGE